MRPLSHNQPYLKITYGISHKVFLPYSDSLHCQRKWVGSTRWQTSSGLSTTPRWATFTRRSPNHKPDYRVCLQMHYSVQYIPLMRSLDRTKEQRTLYKLTGNSQPHQPPIPNTTNRPPMTTLDIGSLYITALYFTFTTLTRYCVLCCTALCKYRVQTLEINELCDRIACEASGSATWRRTQIGRRSSQCARWSSAVRSKCLNLYCPKVYVQYTILYYESNRPLRVRIERPLLESKELIHPEFDRLLHCTGSAAECGDPRKRELDNAARVPGH